MDDFETWRGRTGLLGDATMFVDALEIAYRLAACEATALITGETGTGKELLARAIHYLGTRHDGPFVPVNCGALPDALAEAELFGHVRGAYTDARDNQGGLIGEAERGTLFFDEVEALSSAAQVKLLRFLQDLSYRPVGGSALKYADVRIIAATNVDLRDLVAKRAWREDLYFRLHVVPVCLPPLRMRGTDVLLIARSVIARVAPQFGVAAGELDPRSIDWMLNYDWPGNVRELENLIQRQFVLGSGPQVSVHPGADTAHGSPHRSRLTDQSFQEARACVLRQFERAYLKELLQRTGGNISRASRMCGRERRSLGRLLQKHGIDRATQ